MIEEMLTLYIKKSVGKSQIFRQAFCTSDREALMGLVIVSTFISITPFLAMALLHTGAAPVTKFLFIAGGTDTPLTGIPVISRRAGKRKSILRSFRTHKDHAPFFYIIDLSKKRFNTNNQKIQRNT